jgi:hypothetical protein
MRVDDRVDAPTGVAPGDRPVGANAADGVLFGKSGGSHGRA